MVVIWCKKYEEVRDNISKEMNIFKNHFFEFKKKEENNDSIVDMMSSPNNSDINDNILHGFIDEDHIDHMLASGQFAMV